MNPACGIKYIGGGRSWIINKSQICLMQEQKEIRDLNNLSKEELRCYISCSLAEAEQSTSEICRIWIYIHYITAIKVHRWQRPDD